MTQRLWADLALVAVTIVWGTTFVVVKDAVADVGPLTLIALRFSIGLAALALLYPRSVGAALSRWPAGLALGLSLGSGFALQTAGLQVTTAAKAGFITGLNVVLVPFLALWLLRQRPGPNAVAGVALATVGLGLVSLRGDLTVEIGDLLVLGCAFAFALHIVLTSQFTHSRPVATLLAQQLAVVAGLTSVGALALERPGVPPLPIILAAAYLGAIATALVFAIQTWAQRFTTPTHTGLIYALEPVFAAFFAWLWHGELLTGRALFGCILILAGVCLAELPIALWRKSSD
ncbi:MAG: DMT family transporter [Chloroflexi bacterium]|nr:DMT family transporter [Chloroflexota bacterium]